MSLVNALFLCIFYLACGRRSIPSCYLLLGSSRLSGVPFRPMGTAGILIMHHLAHLYFGPAYTITPHSYYLVLLSEHFPLSCPFFHLPLSAAFVQP